MRTDLRWYDWLERLVEMQLEGCRGSEYAYYC